MTSTYAYDGFDTVLGLDLASVTGDEVRATLPVTAPLLQPYGLLHGGVLCSIVETVGSAGGAAWFGERGTVVGTSNHTDFFRATREGDVLTAVATPVHRGRTQQVWTVRIVDGQDRLVAQGSLRVANLPAERG
jgi:1,4-dihydroxy-2-naphthoyl-CoA hydrolase